MKQTGLTLEIKVVPGSKEFRIVGFDSWSNALKIKVKSAPEKGKANKELTEKLEETLKAKVKILQGEHSSTKKILVENYSKEKLLKAINN